MKKSKIDTYSVGTKCMFHGQRIQIVASDSCTNCVFSEFYHPNYPKKYCRSMHCGHLNREDHTSVIFQEIPKSTKKLITDHPINKPFVWHKMTYIPRKVKKWKLIELVCYDCCFYKTRKGFCDPKQHSCVPSERKDKQNVFYQKKTK